MTKTSLNMAVRRGFEIQEINLPERRIDRMYKALHFCEYEKESGEYADEYFASYRVNKDGSLSWVGCCYELISDMPSWIKDEKHLRSVVKEIGRLLGDLLSQ